MKTLKSFWSDNWGFICGAIMGIILVAVYLTQKTDIPPVAGKDVLDYKQSEIAIKKDMLDSDIVVIKDDIVAKKEDVKVSDKNINNIKIVYETKLNDIYYQSSDADFELFSKWLSQADSIRKR